MAITNIHPIKKTESKAIDYITSDKILSDDIDEDILNSVNYIMRDKIKDNSVVKTLSSFHNCTSENAAKEFQYIRKLHNKNNGNLSYHVWQSFEEKISPELAHEIGMKFATELFSDYQFIVSTHDNTDHTHNHIIFNAVKIANGEKYNDCNSTYRKIRQVSDRLCEEYGLNVLEHTKDYKVSKYVNENGKVSFFEPTDRKLNDKKMDYSNVNDYRNYKTYLDSENITETLRSRIIKDIDLIADNVSSYDELLNSLVAEGYEIRSRRNDGSYLKHISFKHPDASRFLRDTSLGESYTRLNLTDRINQRLSSFDDKSIDTVNRDVMTSNPIISLLSKDSKVLLDSIDKDVLLSLKGKKNTYISDRTAYLISQINKNIETIRFVENENVNSNDDIKSLFNSLFEKRKTAFFELNQCATELKEGTRNKKMIDAYFSFEGNENKVSEAKLILQQLSRRGIERENFETYYSKVSQLEGKFESLSLAMKAISDAIDDSIAKVKTISKASERMNISLTIDLNEYVEMKKNHNRELSDSQKIKNRKYDR